MKIIYSVILSIAPILFSNCSKSSLEYTPGTVKDYTGLDGCGLVIVLDNGKNLEPVSLPSGITLIPDRRVEVKYKNVEMATNCMVGYTVKITHLRYL